MDKKSQEYQDAMRRVQSRIDGILAAGQRKDRDTAYMAALALSWLAARGLDQEFIRYIEKADFNE